MCPLYVSGLIGPGDRKSVQPMAKRLALGACDQLHHFIAAGVWDAGPLETELLVQADKLVGGSDAVLVIDDTAIPKKGTHSVGVAAQYASALGKTANCQTLVSLTLARGEVPVVLALRERLKLRASSGRDEALDLEIGFVAPSLEAHLRLTPLRDIPVNPRLSAAWWQSGFEEPVISMPRDSCADVPDYA